MGMLDMLLGKKDVPAKRNPRNFANSTQFAPSQLSPQSSVTETRKDLLKVVMRETLTRNGIPLAWLSAEMLKMTSSRREPGLHVRFQMRVWEPRLLECGPALEQDFVQRLLALDPQSEQWLLGFSWQFAMGDKTRCPELPHPGSWTGPRVGAVPTPIPAPETKPGDIIEGPVVIPKTPEDVKADLERLLAARDDDVRRHTQGGDHFAATRPASI